ncbi:hypothetical protein JCM17380_05750 [Desulfosporosinus burensis]
MERTLDQDWNEGLDCETDQTEFKETMEDHHFTLSGYPYYVRRRAFCISYGAFKTGEK